MANPYYGTYGHTAPQQPHSEYGSQASPIQQYHATMTSIPGSNIDAIRQPPTTYGAPTASASQMPANKRLRLSGNDNSLFSVQDNKPAYFPHGGLAAHSSPSARLATMARAPIQEIPYGFANAYRTPSSHGAPPAQRYPTSFKAHTSMLARGPVSNGIVNRSQQLKVPNNAFERNVSQAMTLDLSPVNAMVRTASPSSSSRQSPSIVSQNILPHAVTAYANSSPAQRPHNVALYSHVSNTTPVMSPSPVPANSMVRTASPCSSQHSTPPALSAPSRVSSAYGTAYPTQGAQITTPRPVNSVTQATRAVRPTRAVQAPEDAQAIEAIRAPSAGQAIRAFQVPGTVQAPSATPATLTTPTPLNTSAAPAPPTASGSNDGSPPSPQSSPLEQSLASSLSDAKRRLETIHRALNIQKFVHELQQKGLSSITRDIVRHFRIGKQEARRDLGSEVYHAYADSTGFVYCNLTLTRVDVTSNINERVVLSIYESDFAPHNYCTHMRYRSGGIKTAAGAFMLANGTDYAAAFKAFRKAFKKYARLSWEHRFLPQDYIAGSIRRWEHQQRMNLEFAKWGERRRSASRSPSPVFGDSKEKKRGQKRKASSSASAKDELTPEELHSCLVRAFKYAPPANGVPQGEIPMLGGKYVSIPGDEPDDDRFIITPP
ncbi:hypothetical protein B0J12DRAFT_663655 [Macrophomina phaseolina]|uniref:WGR domain-containing protein n=1 Tax=Macrophomina phaseolina TaxID=35725 RepID=A0ABQ8GAW5_9PEZI|nr:hypothetical protein B0J12DRAFT_663655 [Macrophomina phaseolina]